MSWRIVSGLLLLAVLSTGCTTKSKAKAEARSAFMAGQMQALQQAEQQRQAASAVQPAAHVAPASVSVMGEVGNPQVLWVPGLTLAQAIFAAQYRGARDPRFILIIRGDQNFKVNPRQLLDGLINPVLEPGDVVELRP